MCARGYDVVIDFAETKVVVIEKRTHSLFVTHTQNGSNDGYLIMKTMVKRYGRYGKQSYIN